KIKLTGGAITNHPIVPLPGFQAAGGQPTTEKDTKEMGEKEIIDAITKPDPELERLINIAVGAAGAEKPTQQPPTSAPTQPTTLSTDECKKLNSNADCINIGVEGYKSIPDNGEGLIKKGDVIYRCKKGLCKEEKKNENDYEIACCVEDRGCKNRGEAYDCIEEDKGTDCKNGALCPSGLKCCRPKTCNDVPGAQEVDEKEAAKKCREVVNATNLVVTQGKVCCKTKEEARELVKQPGTLSRLNSCFGKYWLWGKQDLNSSLDKAKQILEQTTGTCVNNNIKSEITGDNKGIEKIKTIMDLEERADAINDLLPKIGELVKNCPTVDDKGNPTNDAAENIKILKNLTLVQNELEKARSVVAMTITEVATNMISCLAGMSYAGALAFGDSVGAGLGMLSYGSGVLVGRWKGDVGALAGTLTASTLTSIVAGGGDREMGSCSPERPLVGTDKCLSCNEDPFRICTRERCAILGTCIAVPTAKADQFVCIPGKCEEVGLPLFPKINVSWFVDGEMNGTTGMKEIGNVINIKLDDYNNKKPIPFNTKTILINLTTDKPAQCKYIVDKKNASFSEMTDFENNYFPTLPDGTPGWQHAYVLIPGDFSRNATHRIFIKCKNACGVEPNASYNQNIITFTLDKKPDQLPPEIVYVDPAPNSMIRSDIATVNVSFWLDERGSCKFSDKSNNFTIYYNTTAGQPVMQPFGPYNHENSSVIDGSCSGVGKCLDRNETCTRCWLLLNLSRGYDIINYSSNEFNETKFYNLFIRCNDVAGNIMPEDKILDYSFMTAPGYNITILKPEKNERTYDRTPEIEVTSEPRLTECRYRIFTHGVHSVPKSCDAKIPELNWSNMRPIDSGMSTLHQGEHNETLNASPQGTQHMLCVKCRDMWQIEATARADFYTLLDQQEPIIIRMYHDSTAGDYLVVETNEEAECVYGTDDTIKCNYNFTDGNAMTTTNSYLHAAYWQLDNLYYIKCKDKWNNYPGKSSNANQCTMIISPYEVPAL
ncbi:MAG: hypothetical protein N3G19_01850, partial [Candidatus Pacearchaeota archaeon]|nr:hypothetical protein [Candidatus Pacearchaeota archaeon]